MGGTSVADKVYCFRPPNTFFSTSLQSLFHLESVTLCFFHAPLQDASKVPSWLLVNKTLIPDFVIRDPKVGRTVSSDTV